MGSEQVKGDAVEHNIVIEQWSTFDPIITFNQDEDTGDPVDLSGCTAEMQIRKRVGSEDALASLNTANGGITLGGVLGTMALYISDSGTGALTFKKAVYDITITFSDNTVRRVLEGKVTLDPGVTR